MPIHTESSCMSGGMERVMAKQVHAAGNCAVVRAAGGRMFWMYAADARAVKPGSDILVEGGEHAALGPCCPRAILAGPVASADESLFEGPAGYGSGEGAKFDSDGLPLCPDCGAAMDWAAAGGRDLETAGGYGVEYLVCPSCGEKWELVEGRRLYPTASAGGRGRGRTAGLTGPARTSTSAVGVGAEERRPGVAIGEFAGGTYVALSNWDEESRSATEEALLGFAPHVGPAEQRGDALLWQIETSRPFEGDRGEAYAGLMRLHELLSARGTVPSSFRELRNWVSGVYA